MTRRGPLCENMTSPTKPEVHNISQRRQRRTKPRPQVACTKNCRVVFKLCEQTDRHTHHNISHPSRGRTNKQPERNQGLQSTNHIMQSSHNGCMGFPTYSIVTSWAMTQFSYGLSVVYTARDFFQFPHSVDCRIKVRPRPTSSSGARFTGYTYYNTPKIYLRQGFIYTPLAIHCQHPL